MHAEKNFLGFQINKLLPDIHAKMSVCDSGAASLMIHYEGKLTSENDTDLFETYRGRNEKDKDIQPLCK